MDGRRAETEVGLVGLGTIAATHLAVLSEIPNVSLAFELLHAERKLGTSR